MIPEGTASDALFMSIDLLPTIAGAAGAAPPELPIDGLDVLPLLEGGPEAVNPHEAYLFYYERNQLQAVASGDGRWKLMLPHRYRTLGGRPGGTGGTPVAYEHRSLAQPELFDLRADAGERLDVAANHPEVVRALLAVAERARADLGDALANREGTGVRAPGRLADEER